MLANFQFQVHVQFAAGKVLLVIDICVGSPTSLAQHAHAHFHPSTTLLPSRDFPIQALLFPNSTSISFFIPPINTVFYLIERLRQYFILLNDVIKNRKRRACVEATFPEPEVLLFFTLFSSSSLSLTGMLHALARYHALNGCHLINTDSQIQHIKQYYSLL